MNKSCWVVLSSILLIIDIFLCVQIKNLKNQNKRILPVEKIIKVSSDVQKSLLNLMIYFSGRDCEVCRGESFYWNKLYNDLIGDEIFIVGIAEKKEMVDKIKERYQILFPIVYHEGAIIKRRFGIDSGPIRIIVDKSGKLLYFSLASSNSSAQESFYFEVIELLRKVRIKTFFESKG